MDLGAPNKWLAQRARSSESWLKTMLVYGGAELQKKLNELGLIATAKIIRPAMRKAMIPVLAQAKATAPTGTGAHRTYRGRLVAPGYAKRSLHIEVRRDKVRRNFRAIIGPSREAFYVTQFVELGTARIPARPFLEPAFAANVAKVTDIFATEVRLRIEKIARSGP